MKVKEVVPFINGVKELEKVLKPLYILNEYLSQGPDAYIDFREEIYTIIKGCYEIAECRNYIVKFKFYNRDTETYGLPLKQFVVLLMLLYPISLIKNTSGILDASFIPDPHKDIVGLNDYINYKLIDTLRDHGVSTLNVNTSISMVTYDLKRISTDFSLIMGINFNTEMFLKLYSENPRIKEIMETTYDDMTDTVEIEETQTRLTEELIDIIKNTPNKQEDGYIWYNNLGLVLRANTGIKHKQLGEFMIAQGLKPDIDEKVIPLPSSNSYLIGGSNTPASAYTDAGASRKSMIMNKKVINLAHYLSPHIAICV